METVSKKNIFAAILIFALIAICACSSKPERAMVVTTIKTSANASLENGRKAIHSGDYPLAEANLDTAFTQAMSIDTTDLLTQISIARTSLQLSYNPPRIEKAKEYQAQAENFAKHSSEKTKNLAQCELSSIRVSLADSSCTDYTNFHERLSACQKVFKDDPFSVGECLMVQGDIYRMQNNYSAAEKAYEEAAKIYTDNRYLSEIGLAWYKVSQARSLAGKKHAALDALDKAIFYDRSAENVRALGTDYYIKGILLRKDIDPKPTKEELDLANYCFAHSADIFTASEMPDLAERSRSLVKE